MTEREEEIRRAELRGERNAFLAVNGWIGMTDEEVTWLMNYCNGDIRSKFPFKPTLKHIRETKLIDEIRNKNK